MYSNIKFLLKKMILLKRLFCTSHSPNPTAAFLAIGNELLCGKVQDTNTAILAKLLFNRGISLKRVEVVPDEMQAISESIRRIQPNHDIVFTSGGIGPTHDDITYEAIAMATNKILQQDEHSAREIREYAKLKGLVVTEDLLRMARFPAPCEVIRSQKKVPTVVVDNIWILPGIPSLFQALLHEHQNRLPLGKRLHEGSLIAGDAEFCYAKTVREIQESHPTVEIGSYPNIHGQNGVVMLTVQGFDIDLVKKVVLLLAQVTQGKSMIVDGAAVFGDPSSSM